MSPIGRAFLESVTRLTAKDFDHIRRALVHLSEEEIWLRSNPATNSIGNLLLHLSGSHRFWIVSTVAGHASTRDRQAEFDARGGRAKSELIAELERSVDDAAAVLRDLDPETLLATRTAFGREWTLLQAIQHTTVHFSLHTGQILQMVKAMKAVDLELPK